MDGLEGIVAALAPPYYAVVFCAERRGGGDDDGYKEMAATMRELAAKQPGFLGLETAREEEGVGITVSYWRDLESIRAWKNNAEHLQAQKLGREKWYRRYAVRIAKVERDYFGGEPLGGG